MLIVAARQSGAFLDCRVRWWPAGTALDAWIAAQDDQPSRPEALRRLAEIGLAAAPKRIRGK
jgi:hypothetical protein